MQWLLTIRSYFTIKRPYVRLTPACDIICSSFLLNWSMICCFLSITAFRLMLSFSLLLIISFFCPMIFSNSSSEDFRLAIVALVVTVFSESVAISFSTCAICASYNTLHNVQAIIISLAQQMCYITFRRSENVSESESNCK